MYNKYKSKCYYVSDKARPGYEMMLKFGEYVSKLSDADLIIEWTGRVTGALVEYIRNYSTNEIYGYVHDLDTLIKASCSFFKNSCDTMAGYRLYAVNEEYTKRLRIRSLLCNSIISQFNYEYDLMSETVSNLLLYESGCRKVSNDGIN